MQSKIPILYLRFRPVLQIFRNFSHQKEVPEVAEVPPIRLFVKVCNDCPKVEFSTKSDPKDRYQRFVDSLRLTVSGGSGGHGTPKYGGMGGSGGNVYVEAVDGVTLRQMKQKSTKKLSAGSGENSAHYRIVGNKGSDYVLKAPVGVTVIGQNGRTLGDLNQVGDKVLVALGGTGGNQTNNYLGLKGQKQTIILDLKLIADVGLVGFPNAGKSSLLKAISRADPKIANYPFTTISPNIGVMEYQDLRQISVADLPGLIEGAHKNIGLGHKFLKHIVRTKLLVFVIDINGFKYRPEWPQRTPLDTFLLLNKELELYDDTLLSKPSLLVISKLDNKECEDKYLDFLEKLQQLKSKGIQSISNESFKSNKIIEFDEIIGVCAKNGLNIQRLRNSIRDVIDLNEELAKQENNQIITYQTIESNKEKLEKEEAFLI